MSSPTALYSVRFDGKISAIVEDRSGAVSSPYAHGDCLYTAWSDATLWRRCAGERTAGELLSLEAMPAAPLLTFSSNAASLSV